MFRFLCGLPISYRPIWNLSAARPGHFFQVERSRRRSIKAGQTKANGRSIKAGQPQWPFYLRWAAKDGSAEIAKSPAARPSYFYQGLAKPVAVRLIQLLAWPLRNCLHRTMKSAICALNQRDLATWPLLVDITAIAATGLSLLLIKAGRL